MTSLCSHRQLEKNINQFSDNDFSHVINRQLLQRLCFRGSMSLHLRFRVEANNKLFQSSFGLEIPLHLTDTCLKLPLTPLPMVTFVGGFRGGSRILRRGCATEELPFSNLTNIFTALNINSSTASHVTSIPIA